MNNDLLTLGVLASLSNESEKVEIEELKLRIQFLSQEEQKIEIDKYFAEKAKIKEKRANIAGWMFIFLMTIIGIYIFFIIGMM